MKPLLFMTCLLMLNACNDSLRSRAGSCASTSNRYVECSKSTNALNSNEYKYMYIAEVTIPISVGKSQIIFNESASNSDADNAYSCDLSVDGGKKFNYSFQYGSLILRDGMSNLVLTKANGSTSDNLINTWKMVSKTEEEEVTTELIFLDAEELRIRKTCKVK